MATHSVVGISTMLASSFCERMNWAGNLLVTNKTTQLNVTMVDQRVTLKMNAAVMKHLEERYGGDQLAFEKDLGLLDAAVAEKWRSLPHGRSASPPRSSYVTPSSSFSSSS